jgi:radical SAM superfamily enzyme YgiQ (UPF0313 family)
MNVTFIIPAPQIKRTPIYRLGGKLYGHSNPIVGPMILAAICRQAGHHVEVYQELHGPVNYRRLLRMTDVACIYTMTATSPRAYELGDLFHERGHARVVIGGMHASVCPQEAIAHADQVVVGEGESVILDIVEGRLRKPIVRARPVEDLDALPFPDYSTLRTPCECANIMTSRGCPFHCSFCTTSRHFSPYRRRSVENVIDEIRMVHDLGFQYMNFEDDNFTADKERAKQICRRIIEENLQFKETFFFGRTDLAKDEELLELLSRAHLNRVLIGIESVNQASLDAIDKHQNLEDIRRATLACRDHGIRVIASCVLGIDEDGRDDIRRTIAFASSVDAYQLQPAILTPFPGTPVYEQFEREGRMISHEWGDFDMMNVTFQPKKLSPWELQEEFYHAAREFYTFPSAVRIGRLFGPEYFWRRVWLAIASQVGPVLAELAADHAKGTVYYRVKHTPWMYAPEAQPQPWSSDPAAPDLGAPEQAGAEVRPAGDGRGRVGERRCDDAPAPGDGARGGARGRVAAAVSDAVAGARRAVRTLGGGVRRHGGGRAPADAAKALLWTGLTVAPVAVAAVLVRRGRAARG